MRRALSADARVVELLSLPKVRPVPVSLLIVAVLSVATLPVPFAQASGPSTSLAFRDAVCDGDVLTAASSSGMSCILNVRTTTAVAGGFDVALGFEWTDAGGPAGVVVGFSSAVVTCPATSGSACSSTALQMRPSATTYAPDTQTYRVTATRLCGGAPCDPADASVIESSVIFLRKSSLSILCPSRWPVDTLQTCAARVVDAGDAGPASTPTSPAQVGWTELLVYIESGGVRVPSSFTYHCNLIAQATPNTAECDLTRSLTLGYRYYPYQVSAGWGGDADHTGSSDLMQIVPDLRYTSTTVDCGAPVYLGLAVTCSVVVADVDAPRTSSPVGDVNVRSPTLNSGLHTFDDLACELVPDTNDTPSACSFTFYPFSAGTKQLVVTYPSELAHDSSSAKVNVTVLRRATSTAFTCSPDAAPIQLSTECTIDVVDATAYGTPSGSVDLSIVGAASLGSFNTTSCSLWSVAGQHASRCRVAFTPNASALGSTVALRANYAGDAYFDASASDAASVRALQRNSETTVDCTPDVLLPLVGAAPNATCTAAVSDSTPGTVIAPTGNVSWSRTFPESFTDAVPLGNCTLDAVAPYDCGVGSALPIGDHVVTANYSGDAPHVGSVGADMVHVHAATAVAYNGSWAVQRNASFTARALLASPASLCALSRSADPFGVSFQLDRDPVTGAGGAFALPASSYGTVGTDATGRATLRVTTTNWRAGSYLLTVRNAGDPYCDASQATARILVGDLGVSANAAALMTDKSTNVTIRAQVSRGVASGSFDMVNGTAWKLSGTLTSLVRTASGDTTRCAADGTGTLSRGSLDASGRVVWARVGEVRFGTLMDDAPGGNDRPGDRWTLELGAIDLGTGAPLPGGPDLSGLSWGNIVCK